MKKTPIRRIGLTNTLTLEFIDNSRHVAADRWLVSLTARVRMSVDDLTGKPGGLSSEQADTLRQAIGDDLVYEKEMKRYFIDAKAKDRIVDKVIASFADSNVPYLSAPDFSKKYALKTLNEVLKKKRLAQQQNPSRS